MEVVATGFAGTAARGDLTGTDRLEQAFLEEMLKYCGPKAQQDGFGGGAGENQFQSFLTREHAEMLALRLDLGLSLGDGEGVA